MPTHPLITAEGLIAELALTGVLDETGLRSLLGPDRVGVELNLLEKRLLEENVLSSSRLLQLKGAVSGLPTCDVDTADFDDRLDPAVASVTGAFLLTGEPLTVAMVEDKPDNLTLLRQALGRVDFDIQLITADQYSRVYRQVYAGEHTLALPEATDIFGVFDEALRRRASDIHLSVGVPPAVRVDGRTTFIPVRPLSREWMFAQIRDLGGAKGEATIERLTESTAVDFAYSYGEVRFRVNLGFDRFGPTLAARTLTTVIPSMDDLDLPAAIRGLIDQERGLVLVTGPTGSGKSTTLAALMNAMATGQRRHIITLEDPIEYFLDSDQSIVHQRELGRDFRTFPDALRQALRQDPDVILVGELRDYETMATAVTAAETGHLVFSTIHTYDAASSIARLVAAFPPEEQDQVRSQLSYVLRGLVSQTLLPRASGKGRVAAYEIMLNNPAIRANIRRPDGNTSLRQTIETSADQGMCTMDMYLADLVAHNVVRLEDAEEKARDKEDFRRRTGGGRG